MRTMLSFFRWFGGGSQPTAYIVARGHVYEGGYHFYAERTAKEYGLKGWMRIVKLPMEAYVEFTVEGAQKKIAAFAEKLRQGPPGARIAKVELEWKEPGRRFHDFRIRS